MTICIQKSVSDWNAIEIMGGYTIDSRKVGYAEWWQELNNLL